MTDINTALIAIGPAAVTGVVAYKAARIQASVAKRGFDARLDELERQARDKRRDERAAAFASFIETDQELVARLTSGHFSTDWYDEWLANRYGPANARVALLASEDVFKATVDHFEACQALIQAAQRLGGLTTVELGAAMLQVYGAHTEALRVKRHRVRDAMRADIL